MAIITNQIKKPSHLLGTIWLRKMEGIEKKLLRMERASERSKERKTMFSISIPVCVTYKLVYNKQIVRHTYKQKRRDL